MIPPNFFLSRRWSRQAGLTLPELLVVLGMLAALVILTFALWPGIVMKTKTNQCLANLRQIGVALHAYLADHQQTFPAPPGNMNEWLAGGEPGTLYRTRVDDRPLNRYLDDQPTVFRSPLDVGERNRADAASLETYYERTGCSYLYNSRINLETIPVRIAGPYTLARRVLNSGGDAALAPIKAAMVEEPARTLAFASPDIRGTTAASGIVWWLDKPSSPQVHAHALFVDGHVERVPVANGHDDVTHYRFYAGGR